MLRLYLKAAIFKLELPRTRGESNPRPRDCESRRANHETTSKGHFAKIARRHSESRTISAESSPRLRRIRTAPQRERFAEGRARTAEIVKSPQLLNLDHVNLRRGSCADRRNRKKPPVFEPRPRESPQKVARRRKRKKSSVFEPRPRESPQRVVRGPQKLNLDHANLRRGSRAHRRNRKKSSVFEPRPRESPQRVARARVKNRNKSSVF